MLTLTEYVQSLPFERRVSLGREWEIPDVSQVALDADSLVRVLAQEWSIDCLVERLQTAERAALWFLLSQPKGSIAMDTYVRAVNRPEEEAFAGLRRLAELGLLVTGPVAGEIIAGRSPWIPSRSARGRLLVVPPELLPQLTKTHQAVIAGDTSERAVEFELESASIENLQRIARQWGIERPHEFFRRDLLSAVVERIQDPTSVDQVVASLPQAATAVFEWLLQAGRVGTVAALREAFDSRTLRTAWNHLRPLALVLATWRNGGQRWLVVPAEVGRRTPGSAALGNLAIARPPAHSDDQGFAFARDLITLVDFISREPISLTVTRHEIPKRTQTRIDALLCTPSGDARGQERFRFLLRCAARFGLVGDRDGFSVSTGAINEFADQGFTQIARALFDGWQNDTSWYESAGYEGMYWSSGRPAARRRLLGFLAEARAGEWFRTDDLVARVREADPFFMRSRHEILRFRGARAVTEVMQTWDKVEGRLIRSIVHGPLHWLGVVALSSRADAFGDAVTLTPIGVWLLGGADPPVDLAPSRPIIVQPTFELVAVAPSSAVVHRLNQMADLLQADVAARYVVTRESIIRAAGLGWTEQGLIDFLARESGRRLPQNVAFSIHEWLAKYQRATVRTAMILELDTPDALDEWLVGNDSETFVVKRLGPCTVELRGNTDLKRLEQRLRSHGFEPRIQSAGGGGSSS